jgi:hypothetical protein
MSGVVSALIESIDEHNSRIFKSSLLFALFFIAFTVLFAGQAFAGTISVSSEPIARGSVTPGYDDLVLQAVTMHTETNTAQFYGITINEFGTSSATSTVSQFRFFRESNNIGRLQIGADTTVTVSPTFFDAETVNFQLTAPVTITTSETTFYIVYSIDNTATTGFTIGSNLVDEGSISVGAGDAVSPFTNLSSREITVVPTPHATDIEPSPFSAQTNLCQLCHAVHIAPDFRESYGFTSETVNRFTLTQPYFEAPTAINTMDSDAYNALCFNCHDGTGSATDIKSLYNDVSVNYAGHETSSTGTSITGFKPPPSGETYSAGKKMPCMVCHDIHGSELNNYKMMSDSLYEYSTDNGWVDPNDNGRIDFGNEPCEVCHASTDDTTRTIEVMGIDLHDIPVTHEDTDTYSGDCISGGCHGDPHALD